MTGEGRFGAGERGGSNELIKEEEQETQVEETPIEEDEGLLREED